MGRFREKPYTLATSVNQEFHTVSNLNTGTCCRKAIQLFYSSVDHAFERKIPGKIREMLNLSTDADRVNSICTPPLDLKNGTPQSTNPSICDHCGSFDLYLVSNISS